jgi:nucleoid-associated protein YgaU
MQAAFDTYPLRLRNNAVRRPTTKSVRRARTLKLAGLALALAFVLLVAPRVVYTGAALEHVAPIEYTVGHGDSLWEIASRFAPGQDQRRVIAAIKRVNGLKTAHLESGQALLIPGEILR